jgi:hypothetical protein
VVLLEVRVPPPLIRVDSDLSTVPPAYVISHETTTLLTEPVALFVTVPPTVMSHRPSGSWVEFSMEIELVGAPLGHVVVVVVVGGMVVVGVGRCTVVVGGGGGTVVVGIVTTIGIVDVVVVVVEDEVVVVGCDDALGWCGFLFETAAAIPTTAATRTTAATQTTPHRTREPPELASWRAAAVTMALSGNLSCCSARSWNVAALAFLPLRMFRQAGHWKRRFRTVVKYRSQLSHWTQRMCFPQPVQVVCCAEAGTSCPFRQFGQVMGKLPDAGVVGVSLIAAPGDWHSCVVSVNSWAGVGGLKTSNPGQNDDSPVTLRSRAHSNHSFCVSDSVPLPNV